MAKYPRKNATFVGESAFSFPSEPSMRTAIQKRKRKSLVLKNVENRRKNIVFGWVLAFWAGLSWPVASVTVTVSPSFPSGKKGAPVTVTVTGVAFFAFRKERAPGPGHGTRCSLLPFPERKGPRAWGPGHGHWRRLLLLLLLQRRGTPEPLP